MSIAGVHHGFLKKYGGFMFKQWKEKYLILTAEGSVLVCRDAESPADQVVALQGECEAIVEGREILDLPRLPPGGRRDCCLALILPRDKFLLLLADSPNDCSQWLNMLRKAKESCSSALAQPCKRHQSLTTSITDRDPLPDSITEPRPATRRLSIQAPPSPEIGDNTQSRIRGNKSPRPPKSPGIPSRQHSIGCLRHGNSSDARAVRAVYLLMGGAAASSALGYLGSCPAASIEVRPPEHMAPTAHFSDIGGGDEYHACGQAADPPHFDSFDFEADSDFDAFDCGGFAF